MNEVNDKNVTYKVQNKYAVDRDIYFFCDAPRLLKQHTGNC